MTLDNAEKTTTAQVEALIARIDPALVDRIDEVTNDSRGCRGVDVDPDQRVRQWENRRNVWLVESVSAPAGLDVLDELVTAQVADGWTVTRDRPSESGDGRRVQLTASETVGAGDEAGYGLSISAASDDAGPTVINVNAGSPCFEVPEKAAG